MSNESSDTEVEMNYLNIYGAVGYILIGGVTGVGNLLIALSILKYNALRQLNEYILLMTLALADAFNLFAFAAAGITRLIVIFTGNSGSLIRPLECFAQPHVVLWLLATKYSHLMLTVISFDRFLLIAKPQYYILELPSPKYSLYLASSTFIFTFIMNGFAVLATATKPQKNTVSIFCYFPDFFQADNLFAKIYIFYSDNISSFFAMASVVIFLAILPVSKWQTTPSNVSAEQQIQLKSQRRLTKSLALSCLCTFCLLCVPYKLSFTMWYNGQHFLSWFFTHVTLTNPLANLIIYQLRHHELRVALRGLFERKNMPPLLSMWPKLNTVHVAPANQNNTAFRTNPAANNAVSRV